MTNKMKWTMNAVTGLLLLTTSARPAIAAPALNPELVPIDVQMLERDSASSRLVVAPEVLYSVDSRSRGQWLDSNSWSTWTYLVQVPGAQSLAFHATVDLSEAGRLTLADGEGSQVKVYQRQDTQATKGHIWSVLVPGDTVELKLTLPTAEKDSATLLIDRLFVGVSPSPLARKTVAQAATSTTPQAENWSCDRAPANELGGDATVMISSYSTNVEGTGSSGYLECTATLVNDVPKDGRLFALTAGHCGSPNYDGSTVTVYWNEVSDCASGLQNAFTGPGPTTSGATTRAFTGGNTGDHWLLEFSGSGVPDNSEAVFAGFDAADISQMPGNGPSPVFGVNHAGALTKQYSHSTDGPTQFVAGTSVQYGFDIGDVAKGASGSGLFESSQRTAATLSGTSGSDASQAVYNILANHWDGDPGDAIPGSSSIKQWLDPKNTGTLQTDSYRPAEVPKVTITVTPASATVGQSLMIAWSSVNATTCTGSGALQGNGGTSGSIDLVNGEQTAGTYTFTLSCSGPGGSGSNSASVVVSAGSGAGSSGGSMPSSGGGGGATDPLVMLGLMGVAVHRRRNRDAALSQ